MRAGAAGYRANPQSIAPKQIPIAIFIVGAIPDAQYTSQSGPFALLRKGGVVPQYVTGIPNGYIRRPVIPWMAYTGIFV